MEWPAEACDQCGASSPGWVGASGQTEFFVYSCLSDPCNSPWQPMNNFTAWVVSAQSRALGAANGGACSAFVAACGEISPYFQTRSLLVSPVSSEVLHF